VAAISLREVTKRYADGTEAVSRMSLEIGDGEFIILVGPSGCGKSTALRMIAGLEDITEGELRIGGERVNDRAPKDRDVAMVFQNYALYPHMTVRRNMGFALELAGVDRATIRRKVEEAAALLGLSEHLERRPAQLSGGQRQRVAMGRAIVREPKAFLMDEPLSNLDAKLRVQMRTQLSRLQRRLGTTTVYVTHDQTEAMTLGDRVAVMRSGVIQQVDEPETLYTRPVNLFVAGFVGSPQMNFLPATVEDGALRLPVGRLEIDARMRQRLGGTPLPPSVIAGIRPEQFEAAAPAAEEQRPGLRVRLPVDVVESVGSEVYVHCTVEGAAAPAAGLGELASVPDTGAAAAAEVVARLDAAERPSEGATVELWVDAAGIHLFDPTTGRRLGA